MSDTAANILACIEAKGAKARAAAIETYDRNGDLVAEPGSLSWTVCVDRGDVWVKDQASNNVALASDVDMIGETWEPIALGRVKFIADNDPDSVLSRCTADREMVEELRMRINFNPSRDLDVLNQQQIRAADAEELLQILARGLRLEIDQ